MVLATSAGVSATKAILRNSGARNSALRWSKKACSAACDGSSMVPACAASSFTYSTLRCSSRIAQERLDLGLGQHQPAVSVVAICRRSDLLALLGDVTLLGIAELADHRVKALLVERAVEAREIRVLGDRVRDFRVAEAEPHAAGLLVERRFRHHLLQDLAIQAERARLRRRQRTADLAAELLQPVVIDLPEGLDRRFRSSRP